MTQVQLEKLNLGSSSKIELTPPLLVAGRNFVLAYTYDYFLCDAFKATFSKVFYLTQLHRLLKKLDANWS